jgi:dTDP-4-dehydrorhamnose 3,5-epimerase
MSSRIEGTEVCHPQLRVDHRGSFVEWFHRDRLAEQTGRRLDVAQINFSVSRRGALRGIHYADVPPGQAKYVTCLRGAVFNVVVDIRVGSPTFAAWEAVRLDQHNAHGVYLAEGLGHAFFALTDEAAVSYVCSQPHNPGAEHAVHPLDPAIGIQWPDDVAPVLSDKDTHAPTRAQAREAGMLPSYQSCREYLLWRTYDLGST